MGSPAVMEMQIDAVPCRAEPSQATSVYGKTLFDAPNWDKFGEEALR